MQILIGKALTGVILFVKYEERFQKYAEKAADVVGSMWAFIVAVLVILMGVFGATFVEWSMMISNAVMFWMLFLAQNSENRSSKATHLKLDEIIVSLRDTKNDFAGIEKASEDTLTRLQKVVESEKLQDSREDSANTSQAE